MRNNSSVIAAWVSLVSNLCLTGLKVIVGILFGSQALFADGIHNGADVVASVASLGAMRISNRPADTEHPYGHGKADVIAAGVVGVLLTVSALWILFNGVVSLTRPVEHPELLPLVAAFLSLIWKQMLYAYTMKVGRKYHSKGLIATAYDHLSDVYASIATVVGTGFSLIGEHIGQAKLGFADPIAGIVVALLIFRTAYHMLRDSVDVLMERNVSDEKLNLYRETILSISDVTRVDRLRARELGPYILVDVRLSVPAQLSIQEGHDICRAIQTSVMEADAQVREVLVHLNPWYESNARVQ